MKKIFCFIMFTISYHYVLSQNVGIGTTTPLGELHVTKIAPVPVINFTGSGANDLSQNSSTYNGTGTTNYYVRVSNDGPTPQRFQWSNDNVNWSAEIPMPTSPIPLNNNVSISFGGVTGHVFGATWSWSVQQNFPDGLIVKNGRVGVGTASPDNNAALDISSSTKGILIPRMSTAARLTIPATNGMLVYDITSKSFWVNDGTTWTEILNNNSGWGTKGNNNTNPAVNFIGTGDNQPLRFRLSNSWAGEWNRSTRNFSIGNGALQNLTAGTGNIAVGSGAMYGHTNPVGLLAIGDSALANLSGGIGSSNTAVGQRALYANSNGFYNTAVGTQTLKLNTTGSSNVALGAFALANNVDGDRNIAIGRNALSGNTIGSGSIAIGTATLALGGSYSIAIGDSALFSDDYCCNLAIGGNALRTLSGFNYYNTAIGIGAMALVPSSTGNTAIGYHAMQSVGGYYVTAIGAGANVTSGLSFATVVGASAYVGCNNCLALGGNTASSRTKVGINQSTPFTDLHIVQQSDNGADKTRGIRLQRSVNSNQWRTLIDPNNNYIFEYNNGLYSYIEPVGGTFVSASDARLKKNIQPLEEILAKLMLLRPTTYEYTLGDATNAGITGFIAQDVEKLFPGFVHTGQNGYKGIAYQNFGIIAVKAIQEQQAQIELLKKENAEMKTALQSIKTKLGM